MKRTILGITTLLFCLVAMTHYAYANDQSWEYEDWKVSTHDNVVKYDTHGDTVHGHQFGFIKMVGNCKQDLLWISWSTYEKGLDAFKGKNVTFRFLIDGVGRQVEMSLLSVVESQSGLTVASFSNVTLGQKFMSLLKKGQKIEIFIFAPEELASKFDIRIDSFSLNGFTATMHKAKEFCEVLMNQRAIADTHAQSNLGGRSSDRKGAQSYNIEANKESWLESRVFFAARHFKSLLSIQNEIVGLEVDYQELAVLLSGGALNAKLSEWGREEVSKGNITTEQLFYIMSLSVMRLSLLAQAVDMNDATVCHLEEARILMSMAKGNDEFPVNCRQKAYGSELQVRATRNMHGPIAAKVIELAKKWVTYAILNSQYSAEIDNYGYPDAHDEISSDSPNAVVEIPEYYEKIQYGGQIVPGDVQYIQEQGREEVDYAGAAFQEAFVPLALQRMWQRRSSQFEVDKNWQLDPMEENRLMSIYREKDVQYISKSRSQKEYLARQRFIDDDVKRKKITASGGLKGTAVVTFSILVSLVLVASLFYSAFLIYKKVLDRL